MSHILVTGGAGYIGSVLVPKLIKRDSKVRLFDQFYFGDGHLRNLGNGLESIKGDIANPPEKLLDNIDTVIHLAALSNDPMANFAPKLNLEVNTEATATLAKLAKQRGVKRFIFASSCSVYHQNLRNTRLNIESSSVNPREHYSRSKYLAEKAILPLADDDFTLAILRKATVVGYSPRLRFDLVVNAMVKTALTAGKIIVYDGSQYRPLIDVRDVADAYVAILKAPRHKINGQVFNLVHKNYNVLALAKRVTGALKNLLGKVIPIEVRKEVKDRTYRVSAAKINRTLGFKPRFSIEQSVKSLVDYISEKPDLDFNDPFYYNIERMKQVMKGKKLR